MRFTALGLLAGLALAAPASAADVKSISRLAFGPDNTLFVADWKAARVHALQLPASAAREATPYNLKDLDALLGKTLGAGAVTLEDMVARPGTGETYVAVSLGTAKTPALVSVTAAGAVRRVDLKSTPSTAVTLEHAPAPERRFWKSIPERSFTVTDMKWHGGELFVAGLSNQDFASTLRRIAYPFDGKSRTASIEIYHATHNQLETRAPIRAMTFADFNGKPYLIAAYTCTPIVTVPLAELEDGAHVRGKTLAELGYGNTPTELISYSLKQGDTRTSYVLLLNQERNANILPVAALQAANEKPSLDKPVPFGAIQGLDPMQAPLAGVFRIDNLDDRFFVAVRRELQSGKTQLVTIDKLAGIRLTDFVSEYNFPAYQYADAFQRAHLKPLQDMLMTQEGFTDQIKP